MLWVSSNLSVNWISDLPLSRMLIITPPRTTLKDHCTLSLRKTVSYRYPCCFIWLQRLQKWGIGKGRRGFNQSSMLVGWFRKQVAITTLAILLISIVSSLVATIRDQRPDLLLDHRASKPISLVPPPGFFKRWTLRLMIVVTVFIANVIPDIGELMIATFPPMDFSYSISPDNPWWLGEKYDGIRCCWNPNSRTLYLAWHIIHSEFNITF